MVPELYLYSKNTIAIQNTNLYVFHLSGILEASSSRNFQSIILWTLEINTVVIRSLHRSSLMPESQNDLFVDEA